MYPNWWCWHIWIIGIYKYSTCLYSWWVTKYGNTLNYSISCCHSWSITHSTGGNDEIPLWNPRTDATMWLVFWIFYILMTFDILVHSSWCFEAVKCPSLSVISKAYIYSDSLFLFITSLLHLVSIWLILKLINGINICSPWFPIYKV